MERALATHRRRRARHGLAWHIRVRAHHGRPPDRRTCAAQDS